MDLGTEIFAIKWLETDSRETTRIGFSLHKITPDAQIVFPCERAWGHFLKSLILDKEGPVPQCCPKVPWAHTDPNLVKDYKTYKFSEEMVPVSKIFLHNRSVGLLAILYQSSQYLLKLVTLATLPSHCGSSREKVLLHPWA